MSEIPKDVPSLLRRRDVAKVLGLAPHRIPYITTHGDLKASREDNRPRGTHRDYRPADVLAWAEEQGITPNWEAVKLE